ncbi:MAG: threonine--tRNA ligase [Nitrospinae bacterium]|nr:threonine--tRNA ligase [Nitrospinota bacterium]
MSSSNLDTLRHSAAHVLAQAVKEIFPDIKVTIGPTIVNGFYYDFYKSEPFTEEDLKKIEDKMQTLIKAALPFTHTTMSKAEALDYFTKIEEPFKVELINDLNEEEYSIYTQGDFTDLCRGPHIENTKEIKAFKLLSTSASYWRGDENRESLQRIYGTAFTNPKDLRLHLQKLEEAKERDHRKLGKELDLFSIQEDIGGGLVCWHPKGARIRSIIEDFWKNKHYQNGYDIIYTPHIAQKGLWETSGHWDFYRDNIYSPMLIDETEYLIKPMNCPFHIQVYKGQPRSYRDLPIRYAELGTVYRYERSGVLHGLLRVRGFTQDDAHIFTTSELLNDEIDNALNFTLKMLRQFGFKEFEVYLSTRPEKYVGEDHEWEQATEALRLAIEKNGLKYEVDPGEGVFYGPKIDVKIKDQLDRSWQCSTIQVDFNLPERFNVEYTGNDNKKHKAIMIHRALLGSLERFFGCLIESYGGAFPLWLAPVQVKIMCISERQADYGKKIHATLLQNNFRSETDLREEKIGYKIREARMERIPYMVVIGDKEQENNTVGIRKRGEKETVEITVENFIVQLNSERENELKTGFPED